MPDSRIDNERGRQFEYKIRAMIRSDNAILKRFPLTNKGLKQFKREDFEDFMRNNDPICSKCKCEVMYNGYEKWSTNQVKLVRLEENMIFTHTNIEIYCLGCTGVKLAKITRDIPQLSCEHIHKIRQVLRSEALLIATHNYLNKDQIPLKFDDYADFTTANTTCKKCGNEAKYPNNAVLVKQDKFKIFTAEHIELNCNACANPRISAKFTPIIILNPDSYSIPNPFIKAIPFIKNIPTPEPK